MKAERSNRINIAWDEERKRTEQPIQAQLMGTHKSSKSALLIAHAKFKALWAPNFSHGEATLHRFKMDQKYELRGVKQHLTT